MELILSKQCHSLTGSLGRQFGYHIKHTKNGFFVARNTKGNVPPDGHWKMICACADLANMRLHLSDIKVERQELIEALREAALTTPVYALTKYAEDYPEVFNKDNILKLKNDFRL